MTISQKAYTITYRHTFSFSFATGEQRSVRFAFNIVSHLDDNPDSLAHTLFDFCRLSSSVKVEQGKNLSLSRFCLIFV